MTRKDWQGIYETYFCNDFRRGEIWQMFSSYLQGCSSDFDTFWGTQADTIPNFITMCKKAQEDLMEQQMNRVYDPECKTISIPCVSATPCELAYNPTASEIGRKSAEQALHWVQQYYLQEEGNNPMNTINTTATANVTQKTDLQTQREYLLGRHREVERNFEGYWGDISKKMREAFNLEIDNTPKTAKELLDGIASGKYTLDTKKLALQDISTSNDSGFEDDDGRWVSSRDPLYAMNWGGLTPDRAGYEKAKDDFTTKLKLLKDQIMTGDPAASVTALQALEAWTPPAAPAN